MIGKKTKEWNKVRAELKTEFENMGITTCEIRHKGCWKNNALGFAHTKKRRYVTDLKRVVLACNPCHDWVENSGEVKMEEYLEQIIHDR